MPPSCANGSPTYLRMRTSTATSCDMLLRPEDRGLLRIRSEHPPTLAPQGARPARRMFNAAFFVALQDQSAGRADVGTHAQTREYSFPAAATLPARERGWRGGDSTPGPCCLGFEDAPK